MKRPTIFVVGLSLLSVVALSACDGSAPLSSGSTNAAGSQSNGTAQSIPGFAVRANWPPSPAKGEEVLLVENLLANNYYFIADFSGSMRENACNSREPKADVAKRVLSEVAAEVPVGANLGLLVFNSDHGVKELVPLGVGQEHRRAFKGAVGALRADGGTPLSTAIKAGYEKLMIQARRQRGYGEYHLVVVTDGEANFGYDPTDAVNEIIATSPVVVDVAGFCIGLKHSLNQVGRTNYREASSPESLREALLAAVLAESPVFDVKAFVQQ
ncbi:MAG: VWA domain-containing protein [Candidatus Sungbacteria bacterium]|nr:VWA domain-containing protein [Candidatus Sungbacteria bacterium]